MTKHLVFRPGYWATSAAARAWLLAEGWKVGAKRTTRGRANIPSPLPSGLYDLHDVACALNLSASAVVSQIQAHAQNPSAADGPESLTPPAIGEPVLRTQAEVNDYLTTRIRIGKCVPVVLSPVEPIDLSQWIGPHECCSECNEAIPGLRLDGKGRPREDCAACGASGMLITTWGEAQTERWQEGKRYGPNGEVRDDGPQVGPIRVCGGDPKHVRSLERQAKRALIKFEKAVPSAETRHE